MSYALRTENKGVVNAGYFSIFTQEVRMGDWAIPTEEFCRVVSRLATGEIFLDIKNNYGDQILIRWHPIRKIVRIGEYEINPEEFRAFSDYIFRGGLFGWRPEEPEWRPDFVKNAYCYVKRKLSETNQESSYLSIVQPKELPRLEKIIEKEGDD